MENLVRILMRATTTVARTYLYRLSDCQKITKQLFDGQKSYDPHDIIAIVALLNWNLFAIEFLK